MNDERTPSRTYYTAQEVSDITLAYGARPTITDVDDQIVIDLERDSSTLQLVLGRRSEFYDRMLCRTWVFVQSAPHQFCDELNEDPQLGTFSVVYDDRGVPLLNEAGFVVRAVQIIDFERCTSEEDMMLQVRVFWYGVEVIQEAIVAGGDVLSHLTREKLSLGFANWWFGDENPPSEPDVDA